MWDTLKKGHGGDDKLKKAKFQTIIGQYEMLRMNEQESMVDILTKIGGHD